MSNSYQRFLVLDDANPEIVKETAEKVDLFDLKAYFSCDVRSHQLQIVAEEEKAHLMPLVAVHCGLSIRPA